MRRAALALLLASCASAQTPPAQGVPAEANQADQTNARTDAQQPASTRPAQQSRGAVVSVVQGSKRLVFMRRSEARTTRASQHQAVYTYEDAPSRDVTVLTPTGLCQTRTARSFRAVQTCGDVEHSWTGYELVGCLFAEAGPLVVFDGAEPLRVQSLHDLAPATGPEAEAFEARARSHHFPDRLREQNVMQHEMESMQRVEAGEPPLPPFERAPTRFGTVRTAFGVWMIEVINRHRRPLMTTSLDPSAGNFLLHTGSQWHTLVAGPTDADYAFLIGTSGYSWPLIQRVRPGTAGCNESMSPERCQVPRGWMGPAACDG